MICLSFECPKKFVEATGRGPIVCIVILEKENIDRMKCADPADLQMRHYIKGPMLNAPLKEMDLVLAYEEDLNELLKIKESGNAWDIVKWLERGRLIKPGDATPAIPLRRN